MIMDRCMLNKKCIKPRKSGKIYGLRDKTRISAIEIKVSEKSRKRVKPESSGRPILNRVRLCIRPTTEQYRYKVNLSGGHTRNKVGTIHRT